MGTRVFFNASFLDENEDDEDDQRRRRTGGLTTTMMMMMMMVVVVMVVRVGFSSEEKGLCVAGSRDGGVPGADDDLCAMQKRTGGRRRRPTHACVCVDAVPWCLPEHGSAAGGRVQGRGAGRRGGGGSMAQRKQRAYHEARHAPLCQADGDVPAYERCRAQRGAARRPSAACSETMQTGAAAAATERKAGSRIRGR